MMSARALCLPTIDIGINLVDPMYSGVYNGKKKHAADIDAVISRAIAVGVRCILITAGNLEESREAVALCKRYNSSALQCYCTVGCHPTRCGEFLKDPERYFNDLRALLQEHRVQTEGGCVAAVGELGLDYDRLFCDKTVQMPYFLKQLELAEEFQLPLFLHDRNTGGDLYSVLEQNRQRFVGGVVHSFTGSREELEKLLGLNLYIGVNGCSLKTDENLSVVKAIPLNRLMIETDGPWCEIRSTHASHRLLAEAAAERGGVSNALLSQFPTCRKEKFVEGSLVKSRSEPCHVVRVLEALYELHRDTTGSPTSLEDLGLIIYNNTRQLFPFRVHDAVL